VILSKETMIASHDQIRAVGGLLSVRFIQNTLFEQIFDVSLQDSYEEQNYLRSTKESNSELVKSLRREWVEHSTRLVC
jgi:hypothetical protein